MYAKIITARAAIFFLLSVKGQGQIFFENCGLYLASWYYLVLTGNDMFRWLATACHYESCDWLLASSKLPGM